MNVDPAHAATMQVASANERDDVAVRDRPRLVAREQASGVGSGTAYGDGSKLLAAGWQGLH